MGRPRQIKGTRRDSNGSITHVVGAFGEVPIREAARQIRSGKVAYATGAATVGTVNGRSGPHLRSAPDGKAKNNLGNL